MALHAIKAGEGDVFISAGVETVSRARQGQHRHAAGHRRTRCSTTPRPAPRRRAEGGAPTGTTRARTVQLPDVYIAMGQTAENVAAARGRHPRRSRTSSASAPRTSPSRRSRTGFWAREITPVTLPDGTVVDTRRRAAAGRHPGGRVRGSSRCSARTAPSRPGNCCPLNDGAAAVVVMSDTKARELGITPLARIVVDRRLRAVARDHGARPGRGVAGRRWPGPA